MNYSLRPATAGDAGFLWVMLYEASYAAENGVPDVAALREHAELARYVEGWGDRTDLGVVACAGDSGDPVGAAWLRLLTGEAKACRRFTRLAWAFLILSFSASSSFSFRRRSRSSSSMISCSLSALSPASAISRSIS